MDGRGRGGTDSRALTARALDSWITLLYAPKSRSHSACRHQGSLPTAQRGFVSTSGVNKYLYQPPWNPVEASPPGSVKSAACVPNGGFRLDVATTPPTPLEENSVQNEN